MALPEGFSSFEVQPEDEGNPFRATVTGNLDFSDGMIRIVPPVLIGAELLKNVSGGSVHELNFWAMSNAEGVQATLIDYGYGDVGPSVAEDNRLNVEETARAILHR